MIDTTDASPLRHLAILISQVIQKTESHLTNCNHPTAHVFGILNGLYQRQVMIPQQAELTIPR